MAKVMQILSWETDGGNQRVVIATPEIKVFKVEDNYDFIVIGCDGIFDKLSNL